MWEIEEMGGFVEESVQETEQELLFFPTLFFVEVVPRMLAQLFPFDIPFCFAV